MGAHIEFDLPDADRIWVTEFVGEKTPRRSNRVSTSKNAPASSERSFDEGNDELSLIEDINEKTPIYIPDKGIETNIWQEKDDLLLKTLYVDRQCPLDVIAVVFKCDEANIKEHLQKLNLIR